MDKKILLCGETSAGKDTLARILQDKYNLTSVVSYATRPKRPKETEGIEHKFISDEEADKLIAEEEIIAYTRIGDIRYFATKQDLELNDIYVIDPLGIKYLKDKFPEIPCLVAYVTCPEDVRRERAKQRGDAEDKLNNRIEAEAEQFENFRDYDMSFVNIRGLKELELFADLVVEECR